MYFLGEMGGTYKRCTSSFWLTALTAGHDLPERLILTLTAASVSMQEALDPGSEHTVALSLGVKGMVHAFCF